MTILSKRAWEESVCKLSLLLLKFAVYLLLLNWSLLGVEMNLGHAHKTRFRYLLGVFSKISDEQPPHFYREVPPGFYMCLDCNQDFLISFMILDLSSLFSARKWELTYNLGICNESTLPLLAIKYSLTISPKFCRTKLIDNVCSRKSKLLGCLG